MNLDHVEVVRLDEQPDVSISELAAVSGLLESELQELVDYGVITPVDEATEAAMFRAQRIVTTRVAFRLRCAFDLDVQGLAVTITLLQRVEELKADLAQARAWLPGVEPRRRSGSA